MEHVHDWQVKPGRINEGFFCKCGTRASYPEALADSWNTLTDDQKRTNMNDRTRWYDEAAARWMTPREGWAARGLLTEEPPYTDHADAFLRLLAIAERTQVHGQK